MNGEIFNPEISGKDRRDLFEKFYIEFGLTVCGGNRAFTARFLGITQATLLARIRKYFLEKDVYKHEERREIYKTSYRLSTNERDKDIIKDEIVKRVELKIKRFSNSVVRDIKLKELFKKYWFRQLNDIEKEKIVERYYKLY